MKKKAMIIGKDILGDKGFCMVPSKMKDDKGNDVFYDQLKIIRKNIPNMDVGDRCLISTSIASSKDLKELKYNYIPTISQADFDIFEPSNIYFNIQHGDNFTPVADFIVWDIEMPCNVMTFSKTAPVIYCETENGACALGIMLTNSIINHGKYFFDKLFKHMGASIENKVDVSIITCTSIVYEYLYMSLTDYLSVILSKHPFVSSVMNSGISPEKNPDICYSVSEEGNHVVVIY